MLKQHRTLIVVGFVLLVLSVVRGTITLSDLILILAIVPSIVLHEVSHGYVAYMFGDDTAKRAGRLSLNPIKHIDIFGTLILPAALTLLGIPPIGYAKPVPINPQKLRRPRDQGVLVAIAGPVTNILISIVAGFVAHYLITSAIASSGVVSSISIPLQFVIYVGYLNLYLAIFNLIPIPPLDGSAVLEWFLPDRLRPGYYAIRRYSMFILLGIFLLAPSAISTIASPVVRLWLHTFTPFA